MCSKAVFDSAPNQSKTQETCDEGVDDFAHALKLVFKLC